MAEKTLNTRLQLKTDTSTNWAKATNFVPKSGEAIIYSDLRKIKIGDGTTTVVNLPFLAGTLDNLHDGTDVINTNAIYQTGNTVSNTGAAAFGSGTSANAEYSFTEGISTVASGRGSHAAGIGTIASNEGMTAIGKYNTTPTANEILAVGVGTDDNSRQNLITTYNTGLTEFKSPTDQYGTISVNASSGIECAHSMAACKTTLTASSLYIYKTGHQNAIAYIDGYSDGEIGLRNTGDNQHVSLSCSNGITYNNGSTSRTKMWEQIITSVGKFSTTNPALTATSGSCTWTITDSVRVPYAAGTSDLIVQVYEVATGKMVQPDITIDSGHDVIITFDSSTDIAANTYKTVILG